MPATRTPVRWLPAALALVAVATLAGCGSGGNSPTTRSSPPSSRATPAQQAVIDDNGAGGRRGGTLRVVSNQDITTLDPGQAYNGVDLAFLSVTQRTLYAYKPNDPSEAVPDLASGAPQVSDGGRTLTVKLRAGVHYGPPVNREVKSSDIKYAIERGFNPHVANPYAPTYYGDLVGADRARGGTIRGIVTPDSRTIVMHFTRPVASIVAASMILPLDAPVPPEYAKRYDAKSPSTYGQHQVATGPYMLPAGKDNSVIGTGYEEGKDLTLVRNPNWDRSTDFRPAYVDRVDWTIGADPTIGARQVLEGSDSFFLDAPNPATVRLAYQRFPNQIYFSPGAGSRYVTLNTSKPPFDNANLRRAFAAALDRQQMLTVRGGAILGTVATHLLYPGVAGFDDAGGDRGFGFDFLAHPEGDMDLARRYMRAAGYPSGRYTGSQRVLEVGFSGAPDSYDAQIAQRALQALGFKVNFQLKDQGVVYSDFCERPRSGTDVCPNVGWTRDFADPQTVLDAAFDGDAISPENNPNMSMLNDPAIDRAMARAELVTGDAARARAWAQIDRMITETAAAVPWLWDKEPILFSKNTQCVDALWNQGYCDFAFSSLK